MRGNCMSKLERDDERHKLEYASANNRNAAKHLHSLLTE